jgi:hypothetical protein
MPPPETFIFLDANVLPLDKLEAALADTKREVYWKPAHVGGILCVPLDDEGMSGGVHVEAYKQRHTFQGVAIAVNKTKHIAVGDLVSADMGRLEEVKTALGEMFVVTTEPMLSGVDDEFSKQPEPKEKLLPSGLWIATDAPT